MIISRCFLGENAGPAQRPDCNRYMEALFLKLYSVFPSNVRKDGKTIVRWTLVSQTYKDIRNMVLNNRTIMEQTNIQLAEVNNATLVQWYVNQNVKGLLIYFIFLEV